LECIDLSAKRAFDASVERTHSPERAFDTSVEQTDARNAPRFNAQLMGLSSFKGSMSNPTTVVV
jgi:hypothetical protein